MQLNKIILFLFAGLLLSCADGGDDDGIAPKITAADYSRNVLSVTIDDPDSNGGMIFAEWYVWQFDKYEHWESTAYKYLQNMDVETYQFGAHQLYGYEWLVVLQAEDGDGNASDVFLLYADTTNLKQR